MSTIALIHEGSISIEHLASMSTTALAVQEIVKAKGSKRYANQGREGRSKSMSNYHAAKRCGDNYCCPKGRKPHRPTNHELRLVALHDDFDGVYPFGVTVPQTTPQAVDMFIAERMAKPAPMPHERRVATARQIVDTRDAAATQREHLGVVGIEETRLLEMETQAALVQQRIDAGAKAKPNMAALNAERADRFFDNTRRFVLANSRGI